MLWWRLSQLNYIHCIKKCFLWPVLKPQLDTFISFSLLLLLQETMRNLFLILHGFMDLHYYPSPPKSISLFYYRNHSIFLISFIALSSIFFLAVVTRTTHDVFEQRHNVFLVLFLFLPSCLSFWPSLNTELAFHWIISDSQPNFLNSSSSVRSHSAHS